MKLFELISNEVHIAPELRLIPEFKKLITRDKDRFKKRALKELAFIYFFCDFQSPFMAFSDPERLKEAAISSGLELSFQMDEDVQQAVNKYNEMKETPALKILKSAHSVVNKLDSYLKTVDFEATKADGSPIHTAKDVIANISKLGALIAGIKELENEVKKEQVGESKIRGGGKKGMFEDKEDED